MKKLGFFAIIFGLIVMPSFGSLMELTFPGMYVGQIIDPPGDPEIDPTVKVTDNILSQEDLSNSQDYDPENNRSLVVRWSNIDVEDISEFHIYVKVDGARLPQFLGRTRGTEFSLFIWKEGEPFTAEQFQDGPQFNHSYSFSVYAMRERGAARPFYGPFSTNGPVEFLPSEEVEPTSTPTPTPTRGAGQAECVSADEFFSAEASNLSDVTLGPVRITQALLPDNTPASLSVTDCNGDGRLDVNVPWSESNANQFALIKFDDEICGSNAPRMVEVILTHGTPITLRGIDESGAVVDTASDPGSDPTVVQSLTLSSLSGIRLIEIEGAEICILRICWQCLGRVRTPTSQIPDTPIQDRTPPQQETPPVFETPIIEIPTPFIPAGTVIVTDDNSTYVDLSNGEDRDPVDDRELVVRWNFEFDDVRDFHIYRVGGEARAQFLGRTASGTTNHFIWEENAPRLAPDFKQGPQFGETYQFAVYAIRETGAPRPIYGPFKNAGPVEYLSEGAIPTEEPTMPPIGIQCVQADDVYDATADALSTVTLGNVSISEAHLASGTAVPLQIRDCGGDGLLNVAVPWSESTASQFAKINFGSDICNGNAPEMVEVVMTHGTGVTLRGLDDSGNVVDTASDSSSDPTVVQSFVLTSASGIRMVEIEGAEICIFRICWRCLDIGPPITPQPTEGPGPMLRCVEAGEFYTAPTSGLSQVTLNGVVISQAFLPDGSPVDLSVTDCNNDGNLDVSVPWTESNATSLAFIQFDGEICGGNPPRMVEVVMTHGTGVTLRGLDDNGNVVDTASDSSSDPTVVQSFVLTSASGIRMIEIEGAEICILRICWRCLEPLETPTPQIPPTEVPGQIRCVVAGEFYDEPTQDLSSISLGAVTVTEASLPDGSPAALNVVDCNNDDHLDVNIPWSESNATEPAKIKLGDEICDGNAPRVVDIILTHGTPIVLRGYDDSGTLVSLVGDPGSDPTDVQSLVMTSPTGIREIEIEGAEICILRICWRCQRDVERPTERPTLPPIERTPTFRIPTPGIPEDTVIVMDNLLTFADLSNDQDLDPADNRSLVIRWNFEFEDVKDFHVYVETDEPPMKFLGRTASGTVNHLVWRENLPRLNPDLKDGPQFGETYQFVVFGIRESGAPRPIYGPFRNAGPVEYLEGDEPIIETPLPTARPTLPGGRDCVEAGDIYTAPASGLSTVNLGAAEIEQALLPDGSASPLSVTDCNGDGNLDVNVPWSESNAAQQANIHMSPNLCGGDPPRIVEIILTHGTPIILRGYDESGTLVSIVGDPGSDPTVTKFLLLNSPTGIRDIVIEGAEICILRICWRCGGEIPTRTPIHFTPIIPDRTPIIPGRTPILPPDITTTPSPTPTVRPEETPQGPAVWVSDNLMTFSDLSNGQDFDPVDNRVLVIRWNFEFTDTVDFHLYAKRAEERQFKFLARTDSGTVDHYIWEEGAPRLSQTFADGPQFEQMYQFRVFAIRPSGAPRRFYGPFENDGPVAYFESEGFPEETPAPPEETPPPPPEETPPLPPEETPPLPEETPPLPPEETPPLPPEETPPLPPEETPPLPPEETPPLPEETPPLPPEETPPLPPEETPPLPPGETPPPPEETPPPPEETPPPPEETPPPPPEETPPPPEQTPPPLPEEPTDTPIPPPPEEPTDTPMPPPPEEPTETPLPPPPDEPTPEPTPDDDIPPF